MGEKYWKKMFDSTWMREGNLFIQFLLDAGLDVNALNKYGTTLLSYAAEWENLELAEFLVQKGADANAANLDGSRPLHIAAVCSREDIFDFFLNSMIPSVSKESYERIVVACKEGNLGVVKSLVTKEYDLSAKSFEGGLPLFMAARYSHSQIVEYLIDCGVDVNCNDVGWTVLHYACDAGWLEVVKSLTQKVCDINARTLSNSTPLHLAAEKGNLEIVQHLLNAGADCNLEDAIGKTAFSVFIKRSRCLEVIILFLRRGAYFQTEDYATISKHRFLKKGILQNTELCAMALVNKFNNADLRKIYEIPVVSERLPRIENLVIGSQNIAHDIAEGVKYEIQTNGYCNVLNVHPIVLSRLCVLTLAKHYCKKTVKHR